MKELSSVALLDEDDECNEVRFAAFGVGLLFDLFCFIFGFQIALAFSVIEQACNLLCSLFYYVREIG